jgi:hypothetical protein
VDSCGHAPQHPPGRCARPKRACCRPSPHRRTEKQENIL